MERVVVSIAAEAAGATPEEVDTFFTRRGWKKIGENLWEADFAEPAFAADRVDNDLAEARRTLGALTVDVSTRRVPADGAPRRGC